MKIEETYLIDEIVWDYQDDDYPEEIELPIWDSDLNDEDYELFRKQMDDNEGYYFENMRDIGYTYLKNKYPDNEPNDLMVYRYTKHTIEESDVIDYINNLPEDELEEFFKKIG